MPPIPLDLADIRKTQRRVRALLRLPDTGGGLGLTVRRRHHERHCYICSRLNPNGKYPPNSHQHVFTHGYFKSCPHLPLSPHNTLVDLKSRVWRSDDDLFDTEILNKDTLNNLDTEDPSKFKIPSTFEKQNARSDGSVLPQVSEETFLEAQGGKRQRKHKTEELPALSQGQNSLVTQGDKHKRKGPRKPRPGHSKRVQRHGDESESDVENGQEKPLKIHIPNEFDSWIEDDDTETANLRYHHRRKSGKDNMPDNENGLKSESGTFVSSQRNRRHRRGGARDKNREGSYSISFSGSGSLSGGSSLTTPSPSPNFMMSFIKSSTWCECSDVELDKLRCTECYCIGRHEKWCISKVSVCPKCGKSLKARHDHSHRKHTGDESDFQDEEISSADKKARGLKVKFADDKDIPGDVNTTSGDMKSISGKMVKDAKSRFEKNTSLPSISPNIHKRAYLLALSDSRIKRLRKDPELFNKPGKGSYFSYFPLYKHKDYNPTRNTHIGLRSQGQNENLKIKNGMKHILGDINISDYYPGGKKYIRQAVDEARYNVK